MFELVEYVARRSPVRFVATPASSPVRRRARGPYWQALGVRRAGRGAREITEGIGRTLIKAGVMQMRHGRRAYCRRPQEDSSACWLGRAHGLARLPRFVHP